jgi:uncharacterized protein YukE
VTGLSVADIDRWQPGDVREVFHAARSRNEANQLASHALATLPAFQSWGGAAADAAKELRRAWTGRSAEALARRAPRWTANSTALVTQMGDHAEHFSTCGQAYATMETHHAGQLDSRVRP